MTKSSYSVIQEGGIKEKEETCTFIDNKNSLKNNLETNFSDTKIPENEPYMETTKKLYKKRRNIYPVCVLLMTFVLLVWLIGLTMVREFQLAELRRNVDDLRTNLEEIKEILNDDKLMDELKAFEDEVNADIDHDPFFDNPYDDDSSESSGFDNNPDEATNIHEEYFDSDELMDKGDFLGEVMEATLQDKSQFIAGDKHPPIKKIMRIDQANFDLNDKNGRTKRMTPDGVPVLEESYEEFRNRNLSVKSRESNSKVVSQPHAPSFIFDWGPPAELSKRKSLKKYDPQQPSSASSENMFSRSSRVMQTEEDKTVGNRRVIKFRRPQLRSGIESGLESASLINSNETKSRRIRRRRKSRPRHRASLEMNEDVEITTPMFLNNQKNKLLIAQFHGDTTEHRKGEHYDGNGRLRHPLEVPYTAWSPAQWVPTLGMDKYFPLQDGAVSVPENGIYFVYAQVYYHDPHDENGFIVYRNDGMRDHIILHCTTMTHSTEKMDKSNTCYTAGAFHLSEKDTIQIKNKGSMRYSIMKPGMSFFGLIKLGDAVAR